MDVFDGPHPRGEQNPTADDTRKMGHVGRTIGARYAAFGTVGYRILFSVNGGLLMPIAHDGAVFAARQVAVVALTDDAVVPHEQTSHLEALARTPFRRNLDDFFEVFVPGRSGHCFHGFETVALGPAQQMTHLGNFARLSNQNLFSQTGNAGIATLDARATR